MRRLIVAAVVSASFGLALYAVHKFLPYAQARYIHLDSNNWLCTNTQEITYPTYSGREADQQELKTEKICLQWSRKQ